MSNYTSRPFYKHLFNLLLKNKKKKEIATVFKAAMPEVTQNLRRACLRKLVVGRFSTEISLENAKIES